MPQVKLGFFFSLVFFIFTSGPLWAKQDLSDPLNEAQALLSSGDYDKAFTAYRRIAKESNNPLAQFSLGLFFQMGWGRPIDPAEACRWHEKASRGEIPAGLHFFAECLEKGIHKPADPAQAAKLYKQAADVGHHASLCSLAKLYITGTGVPKDPQKGMMLCRQSAEQGAIGSQLQMGLFQLKGDESIQNEAEAFRWFQMTAQKNHPVAQYYLGVMAQEGLAGQKSTEVARHWFEVSAAQGHVPAYFQTAKLYFDGPLDPDSGKLSAHDLAKAYLWFSATAKQSQDKKALSETAKALKKIEETMPKTWLPDLDAKVKKHLQEHPLPE